MNKATGERNCIVCGKKVGKNLVMCDLCPRAYHTDCLQPPLVKVRQRTSRFKFRRHDWLAQWKVTSSKICEAISRLRC
jgi:hypothetical protein